MTFHSHSPYATLYAHDGTYLGNTPHTQSWPVDSDARQRGYIDATGFKMRWVSGAEHAWSTTRIPVDGSINHAKVVIRPTEAENAEFDHLFALQKEALDIDCSTPKSGRRGDGCRCC